MLRCADICPAFPFVLPQCDETQPQCLRCKSKARQCTYTHLLSQYNPFAPQHQHQKQQQQQQRPDQALQLHAPTPDNLHQQRLICRANRIPALHATTRADDMLLEQGSEIFHHYTHVVVTIDPEHHSSEQFWRWDQAVRAFAPSHDFLYYAALTLASLHRSIMYQQHAPSNDAEPARHVALASAYQARALAGFAPAVARLQGGRKGNWGDADALLTCSSIILASSFVFPPAPGQDVLDQARQVIQLFYGTAALYQRTWDDGGGDPDSEIGAFVRARVRAAEELGDGAAAPEAEESLGRVVDAVLERAAAACVAALDVGAEGGCRLAYPSPLSDTGAAQYATPQGLAAEDDDPLSTFLPAISALRLLVRRLVLRPRLHTMVLEWPASLPNSYLAALERRDPLALVVLAHWARCLAGLKHMWWVSRWGTTVIRAVVDKLCGGYVQDEIFDADLLSGVEVPVALGGEAATAGLSGAEVAPEAGAEARAGAGTTSGSAAAARSWRPCLEWPARELGDAVAFCWHR